MNEQTASDYTQGNCEPLEGCRFPCDLGTRLGRLRGLFPQLEDRRENAPVRVLRQRFLMLGEKEGKRSKIERCLSGETGASIESYHRKWQTRDSDV